MKVVGSRHLDVSEYVWLNQFAEKVPSPFEVTYNSDTFTFHTHIRLGSDQAISQECLTESYVDIIPIATREQLERMHIEIERLLRDLCGVYTLPQTLVTRDQRNKFYGDKCNK